MSTSLQSATDKLALGTEHALSLERLRHSAGWGKTCLLVDVTMLAAAVGAAELGAGAVGLSSPSRVWLAAFPVSVLAFLALCGIYTARLRLQLLDDLRYIVAATALAAMVFSAGQVLLGHQQSAAMEAVRLWTFAAVYLVAGRAGLFWAQARARSTGQVGRPTLIVGAGRIGRLTAKRLLEQPELGLHPIGFLDKDPIADVDEAPRLPVLGASWDLEDVAAGYGVEHVIVTFSTAPHHVLLDLVRRCEDRGLGVSLVPRLFETMPRRMTVEHLGGLPLISIHHANPKGWQFSIKYTLDRAVGALALLLLSPVFAAAAIAVRLSIGSPIFYRQRRVGLDGREFEMLKFRTMTGRPEEAGEADADWAFRELGIAVDETPVAPIDVDRRTGVGRILRTASIDELPQLWNVFRGDMSLVGPRPERTHYVERFRERIYRYKDRQRVKSGITGWAQINGLRGKTSLADRVEWDNYYIENWSLWLDVKIVLLTVLALFRFREPE